MENVKKIEALREARAGLYERMKELNDAADAESRDLTAEEAQEYDRIEADFDQHERQIARLEKAAGIETRISRETAAPNGDAGDGNRVKPTATPEYRDAFDAYLRARGNMEALGAEQRVALKVGTDAAGGFTVPDEFFNQLVESEREFGNMRKLSRTIVTGESGDLQIPALDTRATAAWTAEEAAFTQSESAFKQVVLKSYKAAAISKISDELLHDSAFDMLGFLARDLGEAIGILENTSFVTGASGSTTTPEGIVKKASTGKTFASNAAITADELIDLYHSVIDPYRSNAVWMMKDSTVAAVRKLKTSGGGEYVWQPGLQAGQPDLLLGRPLYVDPDMPAIATVAESVVFGDIGRGYWIRDVEGITVKVLNELYAANGQVGFRVHRRTDGDLVDTAAVKIGKHPV